MPIITFVIGIVIGLLMYEKKEKIQFNEEFNRGYDYAVSSMIDYGYWAERNHGPRHYGEWITKNE